MENNEQDSDVKLLFFVANGEHDVPYRYLALITAVWIRGN